MSIFDELKDVVNNLREECGDFTELDSSDFPSEKIGSYQRFTMEEAAALFEEQLQTIESAIKDEAGCMRYISEDDMRFVRNSLPSVKGYIDGKDYQNFTIYVEQMIAYISPFAMLSMEKMDSKRYSEIKELETVLREIKKHRSFIVRAVRTVGKRNQQLENTYNDVNSKLEALGENVDENQKKSNALGQLQESSEKHHQQIQTMHNDIQSKKTTFDEFSDLIQKRNADIATQTERARHYEEKLEKYEEEYTQMMSTHDTERKELFEKYRELINQIVEKHNMEREELLKKSHELINETINKHNAEREGLLQKARELISSAERAVELKSSEGLSKYFLKKEQQMGDEKIKKRWISLILGASASAVVLGWYTSHTAEEGLGLVTLTRTFLMLIAIGVASFAARQYSKNKSIELDYGYKFALAGSYPGLAKAFQEDEDLRAKYAIRFMEEVLQDPQRNRSKDGVSRSGTKTIETEKEREVQKQTESLMPQNDG